MLLQVNSIIKWYNIVISTKEKQQIVYFYIIANSNLKIVQTIPLET
ncbi:hypothetical protein FPC840_580003 [Flavobacterium psychrophilum]|nr:hypothetical protein FPSM_00806 [Flavobacterium psychrophilum]SNB97537.1 hypothetical protein FPC840_580003 [Flavobacterium psychrophilum]